MGILTSIDCVAAHMFINFRIYIGKREVDGISVPNEFKGMKLFVYLDGEMVPAEEAKVSVFDHCFLYGDGVFEGIRVYPPGRIFKLKEHVDRLYESAKAIGLEIPLTKEQMTEAIIKTVKMNRIKDGHIRSIVSRGVGTPGSDPGGCPRPTVVIFAHPIPLRWKSKSKERSAKIVSTRRFPPQVIDAKIKSCNYLNNVLASIEATGSGADLPIMLDIYGLVAESSVANIFIVRNGKLMTPFPKSALNGITRQTVIELAKKNGIPVKERDISTSELLNAEEVFLTGTGLGICPVVEIDRRKIGTGEPGTITKKIQHLYEELTMSEGVLVNWTVSENLSLNHLK